MNANLDWSNNRANIAWTGDRNSIWHRHGEAMPEGATLADWAQAAGLGHSVIRTPAFHELPNGRMDAIPGWSYLTRDDTLAPLGYVSDASYKIVQPVELLHTLERYVSVDERFALSVAGCLDGGKKAWATAEFNGKVDVGGSAHRFYLLATTSYDATMATIAKMTGTRVVCQNTLNLGLGERSPEIKVLHSQRFDRGAACRQLAELARKVERFKAIGDAMATVDMADREVSTLFKTLLEIPLEAKKEELSTRKLNQFDALRGAYSRTVAEGTERGKVWTALQSVTHYVDHDRASRNGDNIASARFDSALFGTGAAIKAKAFGLLLPLVRDKVAA